MGAGGHYGSLLEHALGLGVELGLGFCLQLCLPRLDTRVASALARFALCDCSAHLLVGRIALFKPSRRLLSLRWLVGHGHPCVGSVLGNSGQAADDARSQPRSSSRYCSIRVHILLVRYLERCFVTVARLAMVKGSDTKASLSCLVSRDTTDERRRTIARHPRHRRAFWASWFSVRKAVSFRDALAAELPGFGVCRHFFQQWYLMGLDEEAYYAQDRLG